MHIHKSPSEFRPLYIVDFMDNEDEEKKQGLNVVRS